MRRTLVLLLACAAQSYAHDVITTKVTWSKEISRVVFKRCTMCHTASGSAFSLTTYADARPWAKAISEEVLERRMPPWQAVKGFGEFKEDRGLTQEELELISDWVEGGAPEGDPKLVPAPPKPVKWLEPVIPPRSAAIVAADGKRLTSPAAILAIRPKTLKKGGNVQVVAMLPNGALQPLLWIYKYDPRFNRTYYYRSPLALPAGTRIEITPKGGDQIVLFTRR